MKSGISIIHILKKKLINNLVNALDLTPHRRSFQEARRWLLELSGWRIAPPFYICNNLYFLDGRNIVFGSNCGLGSFCQIYDWHEIHIGDGFLASNNLTMVSASHDTATFEPLPGPIRIGSDVWVGLNVTIVGPVTIGDGCVIGAGSVVLKDIPAHTVAAGVPARAIRNRSAAQAARPTYR